MLATASSCSLTNSGPCVSRKPCAALSARRISSKSALIWFSASTVCVTQLESSRALLTSSTEATLIATRTRNPAVSSRIWLIAPRREASGMTKGIDKRDCAPDQKVPAPTTRGFRIGSNVRELFKVSADRRLTGQILFKPVDVVVAFDDLGLADQRAEQRQRGLDAVHHHFVQRAAQPHQAFLTGIV